MIVFRCSSRTRKPSVSWQFVATRIVLLVLPAQLNPSITWLPCTLLLLLHDGVVVLTTPRVLRPISACNQALWPSRC